MSNKKKTKKTLKPSRSRKVVAELNRLAEAKEREGNFRTVACGGPGYFRI
jgi:hypothetical protein